VLARSTIQIADARGYLRGREIYPRQRSPAATAHRAAAEHYRRRRPPQAGSSAVRQVQSSICHRDDVLPSMLAHPVGHNARNGLSKNTADRLWWMIHPSL